MSAADINASDIAAPVTSYDPFTDILHTYCTGNELALKCMVKIGTLTREALIVCKHKGRVASGGGGGGCDGGGSRGVMVVVVVGVGGLGRDGDGGGGRVCGGVGVWVSTYEQIYYFMF